MIDDVLQCVDFERDQIAVRASRSEYDVVTKVFRLDRLACRSDVCTQVTTSGNIKSPIANSTHEKPASILVVSQASKLNDRIWMTIDRDACAIYFLSNINVGVQ